MEQYFQNLPVWEQGRGLQNLLGCLTNNLTFLMALLIFLSIYVKYFDGSYKLVFT